MDNRNFDFEADFSNLLNKKIKLFGIEFERKGNASTFSIDLANIERDGVLDKLLNALKAIYEEIDIKKIELPANLSITSLEFSYENENGEKNYILNGQFKFNLNGTSKELALFIQRFSTSKAIVLGLQSKEGFGTTDIPIIKNNLEGYFEFNASQFLFANKDIDKYETPDFWEDGDGDDDDDDDDDTFKVAKIDQFEQSKERINKGKKTKDKAVEVERIDLEAFSEETLQPINKSDKPKKEKKLNKGLTLVVNSVAIKKKKTTTIPLVKKKKKAQSLIKGIRTEEGTETPIKYIKTDLKAGPAELKKIGFEYKDGKLGILFDGSVTTKGLEISVVGLTATTPLSFPPVPEFSLKGLSIRLSAGSVGIVGAFLKVEKEDYDQYIGAIVIQVPKFLFAGMGAYGEMKNKEDLVTGKSIFGFIALEAPIYVFYGCYLTGIAGGFGFNSAFTIPPIAELEDFPFVNPSVLLDDDKDPLEVLQVMDDYIKPEKNAFWMAFGAKAVAGELLHLQLLFIVDTSKLQVTLIGIAGMTLPKKQPFVGIELLVQASVSLKEGLFILAGQLTSNSYLIDKDASLVGGFALHVWFLGDHAGDMLFSIGGYHPSFNKPDHYPEVPRVGFNWRVSDTVSIVGVGYFAITPTAAMAGLKLEAAYHSGNKKAWFIASADMLINWKPFYFTAEISIRIGASATIAFLWFTETFSLETAAELLLYGPPVGGKVHIDWKVISFTVEFGEKLPSIKTNAITWKKFEELYIPKKDEAPIVCQVNVANGLIQEIKEEDSKIWIVRADELVFSTDSFIPINKIALDGTLQTLDNITYSTLGISPMGLNELNAKHNITITQISKAKETTKTSMIKWAWSAQVTNVPGAVWSPLAIDPENPKEILLKGITGLKYLSPEEQTPEGLPKTDLSIFYNEPVAPPRPLALQYSTPNIGNILHQEENVLGFIQQNILETSEQRRSIIDAINGCFPQDEPIEEHELKYFQESVYDNFLSAPQLGQIVSEGIVIRKPKKLIAKSLALTQHLNSPPRRPRLKLAFHTLRKGRPFKIDRTASPLRLQGRNGGKINMQIGKNMLYELDNKMAHALQSDGQLDLQIISFNEYNQLLQIQSISKGKKEKLSLEEKTSQLSIIGIDGQSTQSVIIKGWDAYTSLILANSHALLAEKAIIRTQAPMRLKKQERVTVNALQRRNNILDINDTIKRGWLYTKAQGKLKEIIILVSSTRLTKQVNLTESLQTLKVTLKNHSNSQAALLKPIQHHIEDSQIRIHFKISTVDLTAGTLFEIGTFIDKNWALNALLLLDSEKEIAQNFWKTCTLKNSIFPKLENYRLTSKLELTSTKR